jgi:hypothetical protein
MGPIEPTWKYIRNKNIFITIDYVINWVEVKALKNNTTIIRTKKLCECILNRFWMSFDYSHKLGCSFYLTNYFLIKHVSSTTYYP